MTVVYVSFWSPGFWFFGFFFKSQASGLKTASMDESRKDTLSFAIRRRWQNSPGLAQHHHLGEKLKTEEAHTEKRGIETPAGVNTCRLKESGNRGGQREA